MTDLVYKWGFNLWLGHVGCHRASKCSLVSETEQAGRANLKKRKKKKKKRRKKKKKKKKKKIKGFMCSKFNFLQHESRLHFRLSTGNCSNCHCGASNCKPDHLKSHTNRFLSVNIKKHG
jgi:hypothetical protein